jgi:hypothetical protein
MSRDNHLKNELITTKDYIAEVDKKITQELEIHRGRISNFQDDYEVVFEQTRRLSESIHMIELFLKQQLNYDPTKFSKTKKRT